MPRETPELPYVRKTQIYRSRELYVISLAMSTGSTISPSKTTRRAKLQKNVVDSKRSVGVLKMAAITNELPITAMNIGMMLRSQFKMMMMLVGA